MAGIRTCDRESQVQRPNHYTTEPPSCRRSRRRSCHHRRRLRYRRHGYYVGDRCLPHAKTLQANNLANVAQSSMYTLSCLRWFVQWLTMTYKAEEWSEVSAADSSDWDELSEELTTWWRRQTTTNHVHHLRHTHTVVVAVVVQGGQKKWYLSYNANII